MNCEVFCKKMLSQKDVFEWLWETSLFSLIYLTHDLVFNVHNKYILVLNHIKHQIPIYIHPTQSNRNECY